MERLEEEDKRREEEIEGKSELLARMLGEEEEGRSETRRLHHTNPTSHALELNRASTYKPTAFPHRNDGVLQ